MLQDLFEIGAIPGSVLIDAAADIGYLLDRGGLESERSFQGQLKY